MDDPKDEQRGQEILKVFEGAFGELLKSDPSSMSTKFRKMAGSAFAFYRGTACLFYHDLARDTKNDPFINDQTSKIWMHGDLHAENFGTYMDCRGRLIFNVNDFDEAYVGPFTWDLKRFVASITLLGYSKALSDNQIDKLVQHYAKAYRERIHLLATSRHREEVDQFTLSTAQGPLLDALRSARLASRVDLLDSMSEIQNYERRFTREGGAFDLDDETRKKVLEAYDGYLKTLPEAGQSRRHQRQIKDIVGRRGVGIGSAGLPSYNILIEGEDEAVENDIVVFMKQSQPSAVSQQINKSSDTQKQFRHEGHRTVLSQRALQARADHWLGWAEIDGAGYLVAELSPYEIDIEWDDVNTPEAMAKVVSDLGRATAMMHGAGDYDEGHSDIVPFSAEKAIDAAISIKEGQLEGYLVDFASSYGPQVRRDHHIFVELFRNGRIPGLPDSGQL